MENSALYNSRHQKNRTIWHWSWPTLLLTIILAVFSIFVVNHQPREYYFNLRLENVEPYLNNMFGLESNDNFSYRWTSPMWSIDIPDYPKLSSELHLSLLSLNPGPVRILDANGLELYNFTPTDQLQDYKFNVPASLISQNQLYLSVQSSPYSVKGDKRSLGLIVSRVELVPQKAFIFPTRSLSASVVITGLGFSWLLAGIYGMRRGWKKRPLWPFLVGFIIILVSYLLAWFFPNQLNEFQISRLLNLLLLSFVVIFCLACSYFIFPPLLKKIGLERHQEAANWPPLLRKDWAFLTGLGLLTGAILIYTFYPTLFGFTLGDLKNFRYYIVSMGQGKVPYLDFPVEYPPFALVFIVLPALVSSFGGFSFDSYLLVFQLEAYLVALGSLFVVRNLLLRFYSSASSYNWRMAFYGAMLPIISLYIFRRFDILPALLVALAFSLLYLRRAGWAGVCLGLATTTKLYPVLVLPFLFLYYVRNKGDWKLSLRLGVGYAVAVVASVLPFALISFSGLVESLKYHAERGIQIESSYASIVWLGTQAGFIEAFRVKDHKSSGYFSNWNDWLLLASTLLLVAGLLALFIYSWWVSHPRRSTLSKQWPILATFLAVAWFIITNKVFSPQYVLWLLPFLPFLRPWKVWLGSLIVTLGTLDYLYQDNGLVDWEWPPMFTVLIRNSLLLLLIIVVFRDFQQESKIQPNLDSYLKNI